MERPMKGSTFKRCGCRDESGKQLGVRCPKLNGRGHGSWWARFDAPPAADQKRTQLRIGPYPTKAEAEAALAESVDRTNKGAPLGDRTITFGAYLRQWLSGRVALRPSTASNYTRHIDIYLEPGLGHVRLIDLRAFDFEELYRAMRQIGPTLPARPSQTLLRITAARKDPAGCRRKPSEATIRRVHATALVALGEAMRREMIARNPGQYVEFGNTDSPRAVVWTPERVAEWKRTGKRHPVAVWTAAQYGQFLDFAAADDLYAMWHLIGMRGLRRGEAVGLSWEDVDLDRGVIAIRRTLTNVNHRPVWGAPKSKYGDRLVSLDSGTVEVLRTHRAAQVHRALRQTNLVFASATGEQLNPDGVSQRFERLIARSGLPPVRLHDLRHVAATLGLSAGVAMKTVSEQLGHSSIKITSDIYSSVTAEVAHDAAERTAAIVPRKIKASNSSVPTSCPRSDKSDGATGGVTHVSAGHSGWGGWGSNPGPTDYESAALTG
jgi:integrase